MFVCLFDDVATLCSDPTAGNFRLNSVSKEAALSFEILYAGPIAIFFLINILLIINTASRLRSMFNSALMKLLVRLLPGLLSSHYYKNHNV